MEDMERLGNFFKGKKVLITGHTGFKGSWLSLWLNYYNSKIIGISIDKPSKPNLFDKLNNKKFITSYKFDICNAKKLKAIFKKHKPDMVFHLAAQAIVSDSYLNPRRTYLSNVMGTFNILEAIKETKSVKAAIMVTSDKCYKMGNKKYLNETDPLGGNDIYSSSKAACEILINSYRKSFLDKNEFPQVASVRAGNVIGGGDWAKNRIIPDIYRAFTEKKPLVIRHPNAIRPWQHVLDPLFGYMLLSKKLYQSKGQFDQSWNFGPNAGGIKNVNKIVTDIKKQWNINSNSIFLKKNKFTEEQILMLSSNKAKKYLHWKPILNYNKTIELTVKWYDQYLKKSEMRTESINQIKLFLKLVKNEI